jgi:hypothetical protein
MEIITPSSSSVAPEVCVVTARQNYVCGKMTTVMGQLDRAEPSRITFRDVYREAHPLDSSTVQSVCTDQSCGVAGTNQRQVAAMATPTDESTYHAFTGRREGDRIDFIFVSDSPKVTVLNAYIDRSNEGGRFPSDHFPVIATVQVGLR